jgi:hypothetical protein
MQSVFVEIIAKFLMPELAKIDQSLDHIIGPR